MPLISVHLCVKDSAHTLRRAVESSLPSLPADAELVVLDDASSDPDAVVQALEPVRDHRLRVERNDVSHGPGAARQALLDMTDSAYVATMDADDVSLPGRFGRQVRALRGGADLVFSPVVNWLDGTHRIRPGLFAPISSAAMPLHLLVHNLLCNPTMAGRREAAVAAGGYRDVLAEDHDLWLRAMAANLRLIRLATPCLVYRHHPAQTSTASGFINRAFADRRLKEAYRRFVQSRFEVDPTWLDALWSDESGTQRMAVELAPLQALLASRSSGLSPLDRIVLSRTTRLLDMRLPRNP